MPNFTGQLNANEIFASLFNVIISHYITSDNIKGTFSKLVDRAKVDGGLYGDTKLYTDTDVLSSRAWLGDGEASNLLNINRPKEPKTQGIELDTFRQIDITVDNYLSKRAWTNEGAFSKFNSVILSWIRDTKRIYEATTYNTYLGTHEGNSATKEWTIDLTTDTASLNSLEKKKMTALLIGQSMADLGVLLSDVSRDFNDYAFMRSYDMSDYIVVWNSSYVNQVNKIALPIIYHNDNVIDKFGEYVLPSRYFGDVVSTSGTATAKQVRSLIETDYVVSGVKTHVFAGDYLPTGATYTANTTYKENSKVIAKLIHKDSIPFMSAFEVGTSFFNPRSLTENHYLTWGHNTLEYRYGLPYITILAK